MAASYIRSKFIVGWLAIKGALDNAALFIHSEGAVLSSVVV
jgi:hypothetical protein